MRLPDRWTCELPRLSTNTDYLLVLHLSGNPSDQPGISAQPASSDVSGWVHEWLKVGQPTTSLQVLALPDTNYFTVVDDRVKSFEIDLIALREWSRSAPRDAPVCAARRHQASAREWRASGFVFGEALFRLKTTNRRGVGAIGLSIWSAEGRPLDEMSLSFCVADSPQRCTPCTRHPSNPADTQGRRLGSHRRRRRIVAQCGVVTYEIDKRGVVGVFRDNACRDCGYKVWTLGKNGTDLRGYLANTILPSFGPASSISSLTDAGRGL